MFSSVVRPRPSQPPTLTYRIQSRCLDPREVWMLAMPVLTNPPANALVMLMLVQIQPRKREREKTNAAPRQ
ncbi:uncharacterized protein BO87DRAFT_109461 [Aspergillus neoniger CBS 115656]|uniref:Uncharacterized protein n=1 Tax=Aspergillus neoniger (strain CBS 115656) TaxID=1448310 RepID=A0A318YDC0_ASPNB|nr:hypothetical protein BO87DRAFT_109461 [Aspergillus neoniger CBS 115656]PYH32421.1 hypothetical protein BO87DRAFT_109461 [Aspergillus neoniger CBS 115656]